MASPYAPYNYNDNNNNNNNTNTNGNTAYPSYGGSNMYAYGTANASVTNNPQNLSQPQPNNNDQGLRRRQPQGHNLKASHSNQMSTTSKSSSGNMVKKLDFMFPKVDKEFQVKSEQGATFTLGAVLLIILLSLGEIASWMNEITTTREHIVVNTDLNKRMRININITFPALACEDLHVDAMDVAGDSQIDVEDTLVKKQLRLDGTPRSQEEIKVDTNSHRQEQERKEKVLKEKLPTDYCGPCYGAQEKDDQCCQTCDDVIEAYKQKRWKTEFLIYTSEQCIREGRDKKEPKKMKRGQGCNLSGYMTVNRVAGNFHIAMGEGVERDGRHIHTFLPEDSPNFNASHIIHQLSFGPGEEDSAPMNGVTKVVGAEHGTTGLFQYFIKVVPTTYKGPNAIPESANQATTMPSLYEEVEDSGGEMSVLDTNRYFFTERFRPLMKEFVEPDHFEEKDPERAAADAGHKGSDSHDKHKDLHKVQNSVLPGVFFIYEIYPFAVEIYKRDVPTTHLLIRLIAIIGGVFTCVSWLESALNAKGKSESRLPFMGA